MGDDSNRDDGAWLLERIVESLPAMVFVKDAETLRFVRINERCEELLGYERAELLGKQDADLFPEKEAKFFTEKDREVLASGQLLDIPEEPVHTKFGKRWLHTRKLPIVDEHGTPLFLLGISEDITELKRTREALQRATEDLSEARLREAQRMEQLGLLAGGIAHDFNNLLVGVMGNASLLREQIDKDSPAAATVARLEASAERAAELTRQMLAYSGRGRFVVEPLELGDLVEEMSALIEASLSKKADLDVERDSVALVEADATQLRQLVMNLISNASDALEGSRGLITVAVRMQRLEAGAPQRSWEIGTIENRTYVTLEVTDTGVGMDDATLERVFEPFFSTKQTGHGLGLAAAVGIVKSHRGALRVRTAIGEGTTFSIALPPVEGAVLEPEPVEPPSGSARAGGAVLVVDDELLVRSLVGSALGLADYEVVEAENGQEAVDAMRAEPNRYDIVILDLTMPIMSGEECFVALRNLRADLPVLLSSGYDESDLQIALDDRTRFLRKPYRVASLLEEVERLLGAPAL